MLHGESIIQIEARNGWGAASGFLFAAVSLSLQLYGSPYIMIACGFLRGASKDDI